MKSGNDNGRFYRPAAIKVPLPFIKKGKSASHCCDIGHKDTKILANEKEKCKFFYEKVLFFHFLKAIADCRKEAIAGLARGTLLSHAEYAELKTNWLEIAALFEPGCALSTLCLRRTRITMNDPRIIHKFIEHEWHESTRIIGLRADIRKKISLGSWMLFEHLMDGIDACAWYASIPSQASTPSAPQCVPRAQ